jgi:hypothetical protein
MNIFKEHIDGRRGKADNINLMKMKLMKCGLKTAGRERNGQKT